MTLKSLWPVVQQFQNKNGSILTAGKVYVYYKNRTTLAKIFSDEEGTVATPNPVLIDNNGRATVFADTAYSYTIVVCDYYGKELFSQDITLHDVTESADEITMIGSDGSIHINTSSSNGVKTFDMSANTDILATKKSVDDLDVRVKKNEDDINVISGNVENIATEMSGKKDKQNELAFNGSATKTVTNISQDANGEITVTYEDIDLPQEVTNVEITSKDNSVQITETTDTQTNTKKFDLSVDVDDRIPDPATSNPLMDGTAAVGVSTKYAREDHIHPTDTSREAIDNKTTVVLGTSNSKYPTDKAVADFVNSSIATNTANYISNNGEPFTSVEQLEAYSGPVTNNDYAFVTGTDSEGNTYYDRYKATVSGSTVTWALEYRLNNSSFTAAQWAAINSGVTSDKANYWDGKQDALTAGDNITIDGNTISSDQVFVAKYGITKYAEVLAAYNAGKLCIAFRANRYYYNVYFEDTYIRFISPSGENTIYSLILYSSDRWSNFGITLQSKLTFDTAPKAGSTNPVTSDGIKTALDDLLKENAENALNKVNNTENLSFIARSEQRFNYQDVTRGYYYYNNGTFVDDAGYVKSEFIRIGEETTMWFNKIAHITFWDENGNYVSGIVKGSDGWSSAISIPAGAYYVCVGTLKNTARNAVLNFGNSHLVLNDLSEYRYWEDLKFGIDRTCNTFKLPFVKDRKLCCNIVDSTRTAYYSSVNLGSNIYKFNLSWIWEAGTSTGTIAVIINPNGMNRIKNITDSSIHLTLTANKLSVNCLGNKWGEYYYANLIDHTFDTPMDLDGTTEHTLSLTVNLKGENISVTIDNESYSGVFVDTHGNNLHLSDFYGQYATIEHYCDGNRNDKAMPMFTSFKVLAISTPSAFDYFERENGVLQCTPTGHPYSLMVNDSRFE